MKGPHLRHISASSPALQSPSSQASRAAPSPVLRYCTLWLQQAPHRALCWLLKRARGVENELERELEEVRSPGNSYKKLGLRLSSRGATNRQLDIEIRKADVKSCLPVTFLYRTWQADGRSALKMNCGLFKSSRVRVAESFTLGGRLVVSGSRSNSTVGRASSAPPP